MEEAADWGMQVAALLGRLRAEPTAQRPPPTGERRPARATEGAPPSEQASVPARRVTLGWRPHAAVKGPGFEACLRCGATGRRTVSLGASPCRGWEDALPARVRALMLLPHLQGSHAALRLLAARRAGQQSAG